jgi:oligoendopeptidase F
MNTHTVNHSLKLKRSFLPEQISFESWAKLEPLFRELAERVIRSCGDLEQWLRDIDELESVFSEELAWRYIRSTRNTEDKEVEHAYTFFVTEIEPHAAPWFNKYNLKLDQSVFRQELDQSLYANYLRAVRNEITIYRDENISLLTKIDNLRQQYGKIAGSMSIHHEDKELTMQQAAKLLQETDRSLRETIFRSMIQRRLEEREKLDGLFDQLCQLRQEVAANSGFKNYRDYSFAALARFDYTPEDCFQFHEAIAEELMPLLTQVSAERKSKLGLAVLRPWDLAVDEDNLTPLEPFVKANELLEKTKKCLHAVHPRYAEYIDQMRTLGHFDLDSRKGKAPGGYNYPLAESGVPFIFMNATGSQNDVVTMVHEVGHAIHSFLMNPLPLNAFRNAPSEVCELASMSMELISMEHWGAFYTNTDDLRRAKRQQLIHILETLPWVAAVDAFQHWIYENKNHTADERAEAWTSIYGRFALPGVNWEGMEQAYACQWQRQLHIFEVPFYYIEYGMAQLGALAVWRNYRKNKKTGLDNYEAALQLGYVRPIGEIYKTAGIRFDFSRENVRELVEFVKAELNVLTTSLN